MLLRIAVTRFSVFTFLGFCTASLLPGNEQFLKPPTVHSPRKAGHIFQNIYHFCLVGLRHTAILYLPGTEDSLIAIMPASNAHPEQETLDDICWNTCSLVLKAFLSLKRLAKESLEGNKH